MSVRKRNGFTRKMEAKSTEELRDIVVSKDYAYGAKQAAQWELEAREEDGTLGLDNQKRMDHSLGESRYYEFIETVKRERKYTFWGTPSYAESLENDLSINAKIGLIKKTLEKLKWKIVYQSTEQIQALRPHETEGYSEQILIGFGSENLIVKSVTLGSESMDQGRNSVRVKLFFHVFNETIAELGEEGIVEVETQVVKDNNWEEYQVPEKLPPPPKFRRKRPFIFFAGTLVFSIITGAVLGLGMSTLYMIFLYEAVASWILGRALGEIMVLSNFDSYKITKYTFGGATAIVIIAAQISGFIYFQGQNPTFTKIDFFQYMELKIEAGLTIDELNLGSWGWLGVLVLQIFVIHYYVILTSFGRFSNHLIKRIPNKVIEHMFYMDFKEYNEPKMRSELASKGWNGRLHQDYVFMAIGAIYETQQAIKKE